MSGFMRFPKHQISNRAIAFLLTALGVMLSLFGGMWLQAAPTPLSATVLLAATTCGNSSIDPGEECDDGKFNGATDCSKDCKILTCGDGIFSPHLHEECEPMKNPDGTYVT